MKKQTISLISTVVLSLFLTNTSLVFAESASTQKQSFFNFGKKNEITTFEEYVESLKNENSTLGHLAKTYKTRDEAHFPLFIAYLKEKSIKEGFRPTLVNNTFSHVPFLAKVITSDQNQLEKKVTLQSYLNLVLSDARVNQGKTRIKNYSADLTAASQKSGVPIEYIVSLWGMESSYGQIQGKEDIISALSTLAYEGRREGFFTKELMSALTVLERGYITKDKMKGSWAGAMGQCQFMPSSLLAYGKDGDNDGVIDIWQNPKDVFASISNYLSTIGWNKNLAWGMEVNVPSSFSKNAVGLENNQGKTFANWKKLNVSPVKNSRFNPNDKLWLINVNDDVKASGRYFLVSSNFKTLMHWNRSNYFGISVGIMADRFAGITD